MDLVIYTAATDLSGGFVTSKTDLTAVTDLGTLVFGDSEPLKLKFTTAADGTAPAWLGDNTYSVNVSLGLRGSTGENLFAATNDFTFDTDTYSGHLQLSSADLASWVNARRAGLGYLSLAVSVTTPSNGTETYAEALILVQGAIPAVGSLPDTPVAYATYADALAAQTAAEASATSASNSATAATNAKNAAQAAQTAAESAETNAAADRVLAQTAATTATTKAAEASSSASDADADRIAAQSAKTDAEAAAAAAAASAASITGDEASAAASASAALASEQAAAASEAAAAASESAAALSESNAAASESAAAASATTALNAIAQSFQGGIAGNSVPATSTLAGDYYRITSAGTSQSITWAIGDAAIYNGTSGSWTQLSGYFAGQESITQKYAFNLTPRPQVISDGSTTDRAMLFTPGTRGDLTNAALATWAGFVPVMASDPSATAYINALASNSTSIATRTNRFSTYITTGGDLTIAQIGSPTSTNRIFTYTDFVTPYAGQLVFLEIYLVNGTTNPVVRVNTVDISSSFVATTSGGGVDWLNGSMDDTVRLFGYNWPSGDAPLGCWINAALTDADRTYWLTHGVPPSWVLNGGTQVRIANGTFSSGGARPMDVITGTSDGGATVEKTQTSLDARFGTVLPAGWGEVGRSYLVSFNLTKTSGQNPELAFQDGTSTNTAKGATIISDGSMVVGQNLKVITPSAANVADRRISFYWEIPDTFNGAISDFKIVPIGALGFPVVGPDRFVRDATRISPPIDGYMVGMRPLSTDADGWIRGRRTSSGYLQADTQLVGDSRGVVQVLMRSVSGGTASLGESAGSPATVVASLTLTAGVWTPCTILKSVISTGKLYAALGTATDVEVAVRTGPILSLV